MQLVQKVEVIRGQHGYIWMSNCYPSFIVRWILNFVDQPTHENHENWYPTNKSDFTVYGSETWKMTKGEEKILDTFLHKCIRGILKMYWPEKITNAEARKWAGLEKICTIVKKRRWQWIGHALRMDNNRN